jgi:hypothetical protein
MLQKNWWWTNQCGSFMRKKKKEKVWVTYELINMCYDSSLHNGKHDQIEN